MQSVLLVDTRSLATLTRAELNGAPGALDTLLLSPDRVVITIDVLQEMDDWPDQAAKNQFRSWYDSALSQGKVTTPDFAAVTDLATQRGDESLRQYAQQNRSTLSARFLSDDGGILLNEQNLGLTPDRLAERGQYTRPYYGTGEYLGELLIEGKITSSQYNVISESVKSSSAWSSIPASDNPAKVNFKSMYFTVEEANGLAGKTIAFTEQYRLASKLEKVGIVGALFGVVMAARDAQAAYTAGDAAGARSILIKELAGQAGGFLAGMAAAEAVAPIVAPLALTGPAGAIVAGVITLGAGIAGGIFGDQIAREIVSILEGAQSARQPVVVEIDGPPLYSIDPSITIPAGTTVTFVDAFGSRVDVKVIGANASGYIYEIPSGDRGFVGSKLIEHVNVPTDSGTMSAWQGGLITTSGSDTQGAYQGTRMAGGELRSYAGDLMVFVPDDGTPPVRVAFEGDRVYVTREGATRDIAASVFDWMADVRGFQPDRTVAPSLNDSVELGGDTDRGLYRLSEAYLAALGDGAGADMYGLRLLGRLGEAFGQGGSGIVLGGEGSPYVFNLGGSYVEDGGVLAYNGQTIAQVVRGDGYTDYRANDGTTVRASQGAVTTVGPQTFAIAQWNASAADLAIADSRISSIADPLQRWAARIACLEAATNNMMFGLKAGLFNGATETYTAGSQAGSVTNALMNLYVYNNNNWWTTSDVGGPTFGGAVIGQDYQVSMPLSVINGDGYTNTMPSFVVTGGVRPGDNSLSTADLFSGGGGSSALLSNVSGGSGTSDSASFIPTVAAMADHQGDAITFAKVDPLVIDLDGDGVTLLNPLAANVLFDTDMDGAVQRTGWAGPKDGILALDRNGNGKIDDVSETFSEYFANGIRDGFGALATLDGNKDGAFDAKDAAFTQVRVWRDGDSDGVTDAGELLTLAEAGIASIGLTATDGGGELVEGNEILKRGSARLADGTARAVAAVDFLSNPLGSTWTTDALGAVVTSQNGISSYALTAQDDLTVDLAAKGVLSAYGNAGNNTLIGTAGNNWLGGGAGQDTFIGGDGSDVLLIDAQDRQEDIDGGAGLDIVQVTGDRGVSLNLSRANVEVAVGGRGADVLVGGGSGNVFIRGGGGDDIVIGGDADDALSGEDGDDRVIGGHGDDLIRGGRGKDVLEGGVGTDVLDGGLDDDTLRGGDGTDVLTGGKGNDTLDGGAGLDTAVFSGGFAEYRVTKLADGRVQVTDTVDNRDGTDILSNMENLTFKDTKDFSITNNNPLPVSDVVDVSGTASSYTITAAELVTNDVSWQGRSLRLRDVSDAVGGTVRLDGNGNAVFTVDPYFRGVASFRYHLADSAGNNGATVVGKDASDMGYQTSAELQAQVFLKTPDMPDDPLFFKQWYLSTFRVEPVWEDYTGKGINVALVETPGQYSSRSIVDYTSPDLASNIDPVTVALHGTDEFNNHATFVGGIIVAARNTFGGTGVAYNSTLTSMGLVDSEWHGHMKEYDVVSNSYNDVVPFGTAHNSSFYQSVNSEYKDAAEHGRDGLGTVMTIAGHNFYRFGDDTNLSSLSSDRRVIVVGAYNKPYSLSLLDAWSPRFSNPGASILVCGVGTNAPTTMIQLTDADGATFGNSTGLGSGTSAAQPMVAGVAALILEANANLGYRDVRNIMAYSARRTADMSTDWTYNGATTWNGGGLHVSHDYGFGLVDALSAVRLAETWQEQNTAANEWTWSSKHVTNAGIPDGGSFSDSMTIQLDGKHRLEDVQVTLDFVHQRAGDLIVTLTSPTGVVSRLINRPGVTPAGVVTQAGETAYATAYSANGSATGDGAEDLSAWVLDTTHDFGEVGGGTWTLRVTDAAGGAVGTLRSWKLDLYGDQKSEDDTYVYTEEFRTIGSGSRTILSDAAGIDTINAAAVLGDSVLDLRAGASSIIASKTVAASSGTLIENAFAGDGDDRLTGNDADNHLIGGRGNDTLAGGGGDDLLEGWQGDDTIDGGDGTDVAVFRGSHADYVVTDLGNGSVRVAGRDGTDVLTGIEVLKFDDCVMGAVGPLAVTKADILRTFPGEPLTFSKAALLDNDTLPVGWNRISLTGLDNARGGTLVDNGDGTATFTPAAGFVGLAGFDYTVTDILGRKQTQSVSVGVVADPSTPAEVQSWNTGIGGATLLADGGAIRVLCNFNTAITLTAQRTDINGTPVWGPVAIGEVGGNSIGTIRSILLADGRCAIAWIDNSTLSAQAAIVSTDGTNVSQPLLLGSASMSAEVKLAALPGGGFAATWGGSDSSGAGIRLAQVAGDGREILSNLVVNSTTAAMQSGPSITPLTGGGYVVTWSSMSTDGYTSNICFQRFDANGGRLGNEVTVSPMSGAWRWSAASASPIDGSFVVAWYGWGEQGDPQYGIFAQRYSAGGTAIGGVIHVNTVSAGNQWLPAIIATPDGGFIAAWLGDGESGSHTRIQRFDSEGRKAGTEFTIAPITGNSWDRPELAALPDGTVEALWADGSRSIYTLSGTIGDDAANNLVGTNAGDTLIGNGGNDVLTGLGGDDTLIGGTGNDTINGGAGTDTAVFAEARGAQAITRSANGTVTVSGGEGSDILTNVEWLRFADATVDAVTLNALPVAMVDLVVTEEDTSIVLLPSALLGNDRDPDGDPVIILSVGNAESGSVALNADGTVSFSPDANFNGVARFAYTVSDGHGGVATQTVAVNVAAVNDAPTAQSVTLSTWEGAAVTVSAASFGAADVDGDALIISEITNVTGGSVELTAEGNAVFTPAPTFSGTSGFDVVISDGHGGSITRHASVTAAHAPVAVAKTASTNEDTPLTITATSLLSDARDADGDALALFAVGNAVGGTVRRNGSGDVVFAPVPDFNGRARFDYTISDGHGGFDTKAVAIDVVAVNDAPAIQAKTASTNEDTALTITAANLLAGAGDADGDALTLSAVGNAVGGTVSQDANGDVVFRPTTNFNGMASFDYSVSDGFGGTAIAHVAVSVTAVPDPPLVSDATLYTELDQGITGQTVASSDLPELSFSLLEGAAHGQVLLDGEGRYVYRPDTGFTGTDSFRVTASNAYGSDSGTITVAVQPKRLLGSGAETQANAFTAGEQNNHTVTHLSDGRVLVTWVSYGQDTGNTAGVYGRLFDANSQPLGTEFRVNVTVSGFQGRQQVLALDNGGFVVSWVNNPQDGSGDDVFARSYGRDGIPLAGEFRVNDLTASHQFGQTMAQVPGGGFAVVWQSFQHSDSNLDLVGKFYTAAGEALGPEFEVNTFTEGSQCAARLTTLAGGGLVVSWLSYGQDGSGYGVYARLISPDGLAAGAEFRINAFTEGEQSSHNVVALPDGGFVATWYSAWQDGGDGSGIYGQRFSATGQPMGTEFRVNTVTPGYQQNPRMAALRDGGLIATWISNPSGRISGQRYDAHGQPVGGEFQINTPAPGHEPAWQQVVALDDGGFAVAWQCYRRDGNETDIFTRRFLADGGALGAEERVNQTAIGDQTTPQMAALCDGRYAIGWISAGQDGSGSGVFLRSMGVSGSLGGSGDDVLVAALGCQRLDGGGGSDIAVFSGRLADYTVTRQNSSTVVISGMEGATAVSNVEWLQFSDGDVRILSTSRVALPLTSATSEDTPLTLTATDLLAGTSELCGGTLTLSWVGNAVGGTVTRAGNGDVVFSPIPDFNGTAGFDFSVSDGYGGTATRHVVVTVAPVNDAPNAQHKQIATEEDAPITLLAAALLSDASDADGDALTLSAVGNAVGGTVSLDANGDVVFTPAPDFNGNATFDYVVSDGHGGTCTKSVTVTVAAVNDAPVALSPSIFFCADTPFTISAASLLNGATDADGDALMVSSVGNAVNGSVALDASGNAVFTPTAHYAGMAGFDYTVSDGHGGLDTKTVTMTVGGVPADSGEFRVNTYVTGEQSRQASAALADGGFVVTWASNVQDGSDYGVYAQRYGADGRPEGDEFRVNSFTAGGQMSPQVIALDAGGFVVSWLSYGQDDGNSYGIYAQRYGADGQPQGGEFRVNGYTVGTQFQPQLAALADGGFVATWASYGQDDITGYGVYAQRYGADGQAAGAEFQINTYTTGAQSLPQVTALADGGFVVTWLSMGQDGGAGGVYGQRYTANGQALGGEFRVNTYVTNGQRTQQATALADGGFVVTWQSYGQDGNDWGVYGQRYGADNQPQGGEFQVNTWTAGGQTAPQIAALVDGGFVVMWQSSGQDADGSAGIYAQRYGADGQPQGGEFRVNTWTENAQSAPQIVALTDGGFMVTWESSLQDGSGSGVYAQRYDAAGQAVGGEIQINAFTAGNQLSPRIIALADGAVAITWVSLNQDAADNGYGVYARVLGQAGFVGGSGDDVITGIVADEVLAGLGGNDTLSGGGGADTLIGGAGSDTAVIDTAFSEASFQSMGGRLVVTHGGASETLDGVEFLRFRDRTVLATNLDAVPTAGADHAFAVEGVPLSISAATLLANDIDPDNDPLQVVSVQNAVGGTVSLDEAGQVTFLPSAHVFGPASFDYSVSDGRGGFASQTVTLQVDARPVAQAKSFAVDLGTALTVSAADLLAGATDADGDALALSSVGNALNGSVALDAAGNVVFTPTAHFAGMAGFDYTVSDGRGGFDTKTVTMTVGGVPADSGEFRVNTYVAGDQSTQKSAALADGGFVVTWRSMGQDGSGYGVYAQRYGADGRPEGGEFQVNSFTADHQVDPQVIALADGGFVVAWASNQNSDGSLSIYAQHYGADGQPEGGESRVNTYTVGGQKPQLAALTDGGYVVTWRSYDQGGNYYGIYGQRYGADGQAEGAEFQASTYTTMGAWPQRVTALADGGFVVTWVAPDGSAGGVYGRRYSATGQALGGEFRVNTYVTSGQNAQQVTALPDGGYVVIWQSNGQDGSYYGVYGQRYGVDNLPQGGEFQVNTWTANSQSAPQISALTGGGFIVTWQSYGQDDDGSDGIYAQRYGADGQPQGGEFRVNTWMVTPQCSPQVTALPDGGFMVAWYSYQQNGGIYAQRYDASGQAVGGETQINSVTVNFQISPQILTLADGTVAITWLSYNQDAADNGCGVYARVLGQAGFVGGSGDDVLIGTSADEVLAGLGGNDTLSGGGGSDTLMGGVGADTYAFGFGDGHDTVLNSGAAAEGDTVSFASGIGADQLWFRQDGNDLRVSIIGTSDTVSIAGWYQSASNHVSQLKTADGSTLGDTAVQNLVNAMAGFSPPPIGQTTLTADQHQQLDTVIAANWKAA